MLNAENIFYAILPSLLGVIIVYKSDKKREPVKSIIYAFSLGIFFCIPATLLIVGLLLMPLLGEFENPILNSLINSTFYSSIPEELFKYMALLYIWKNHKEFDEPADCIVYGTCVALGFAAVENIFYLIEYGDSVLLIRALSSVPMHAACGMLIGIELRKQRYEKSSSAIISHMDAVVPAMTLHAVYNFFVFLELFYIYVGIVLFCFYLIKRAITANKLL